MSSRPDAFPHTAQLSAAKQALLAQRLRGQGQALSSRPRLVRRSSTAAVPLSFAQQRLWFLQQLEPESAAYNLPRAIRLQGHLNLAALTQSLQEIGQRHEILRTALVTINGEPQQVIAPEFSCPLPVVNLEALAPAEQQERLQHLAQQTALEPFDFTQAPLLRLLLVRLSQQEHVLLLTMHHIIADAWSIGVLVRELAPLYTAYATGQPAVLPELPIQYADFALWQRQWLQGAVLEQHLAYWQQQLRGPLPVLQLPIQSSRSLQVSDHSDGLRPVGDHRQVRLLPPGLTAGLKRLSQQTSVTLFMTLLAAFQTLLYRYTGQADLVVGTPIANRTQAEIEGLIGFFVNTLVLRTNLEGNPSFRELLGRVRDVALGAYTHQDLPFELLVEALQPERNLYRNPLFQVMFALQNTPVPPLTLPDLTLESVKFGTNTALVDLSLDLVETDQGLNAILEYRTDLFAPAAMTRMLAHYQVLLEAIAANPDRRLSELPLITATERQQALVEWNQTQVPALPYRSLPELFAARVAEQPDAIAVRWADQALTYEVLNRRANQLAHHLQTLGVGPEVRVGLYLDRCLELMIAVLGILKAGGAYVPLDPSYPSDRLAFMLQDAEVALLLTQASRRPDLPTLPVPIVQIDADWHLIQGYSTTNPGNAIAGSHLAYVIYTSGSTGKAKGVMVEHHSLVNAYLAWEQAYGLRSTPIRSHLQMASFAFDVFAGDLVRALGSGGTLVLCPRDFLLEPELLYELLHREQIECAEFVPAVLRQLIQYLERTQQRLDWIKLLICGSDRWTVAEYQQFRQFCGPQTRLINSFGVTEATIDSTYFELPSDRPTLDLSPEQLVPIGRPFANMQVYILDAHRQPQPIGIPGELYIGGAGVARGYWNRPDLTAEKFIPNPFATGHETLPLQPIHPPTPPLPLLHSPLPHPRPRSPPPRWHDPIPGPDRQPGEDSRLPD